MDRNNLSLEGAKKLRKEVEASIYRQLYIEGYISWVQYDCLLKLMSE